ncbi:polyprenyl diphosphate synthase [Actinosynnema sp. NPDC002837]
MGLVESLRALYARRLRRQVASGPLPRHVALIMDGNRRWAREQGYANPSIGHLHGGEHLETVLGWCADFGIRHVTVFLASSDNLRKRGSEETAFLMEVVERVVVDRVVARSERWRLNVTGRLNLLPDSTAYALKRAQDLTLERATDSELTVAVGYDGREEIVDAVRSLLDQAAERRVTAEELAATLTVEDITAHLDPAGRPDPDLVIRTSGERRLSGFLLWQAAGSRLHFCDVYWPAFRQVDFLRALRSYAMRQGSRD